MANWQWSGGKSGWMLAAIGAGIAGVGACASEARNDAAPQAASATVSVVERPEATPGPSIGPLGYRIEWRGYPQVADNGRVRTFDVLGDVLVVHDDRNVVTVMEPDTGGNRWALDLGSDLTKFVGNVRQGDRLLCCAEGEIQILDVRTGQLRDRQRLASLANTRPAMIGPMAVFGCVTGEVLGHNTTSGYKQWAYQLEGRVVANPVAAESFVAAVSEGGDVVILDGLTGTSSGRRGRIFNGLSNNPVVGGDGVFIAGRDQSVWAYRLDDGKLIWRHRGQYPLTDQPTYHDLRLYQAIPELGLVAFNAGDGSIIWKAEKVRGSVIGIRGGRLLVWDGAEAILLDADRGDLVDRVALPGLSHLVTDQFVDGNIYTVADRGGRVEKFSAKK